MDNQPYDQMTIHDPETGQSQIVSLVPVEDLLAQQDHMRTCAGHQHSTSGALQSVDLLEGVFICSCGALLIYDEIGQPFRLCSASELEARIYKAFLPAKEALDQIESALLDARKIQGTFEMIRHDNPVLKAERLLVQNRIDMHMDQWRKSNGHK